MRVEEENIKIKLIYKVGECDLRMQVIEMDGRLRQKGSIISNSFLDIHSNAKPQLCNSILFLRGWKDERDTLISSYSFDSEKTRDAYVANVKALAQEYEQKGKGKFSVEEVISGCVDTN